MAIYFSHTIMVHLLRLFFNISIDETIKYEEKEYDVSTPFSVFFSCTTVINGGIGASTTKK